MPRRPRIIFSQMPHHVTQRGNYRQNVFENINDYQKYSYLVAEYAIKYQVEIIAYCLMQNHVHFIVIPFAQDGLARLFNTAHMRYSQYKNRQKGKKGHLWQGRFYSSVLDGSYLLHAMRYVEQNPMRAGLVKKANEYVWSSARQHLGLEKDSIIKTTGNEKITQMVGAKTDWQEYLNHSDAMMEEKMRVKTKKGLVIGSEEFIAELEQKTGLYLKEKKVGRRYKN